jgi:hypothetical protein
MKWHQSNCPLAGKGPFEDKVLFCMDWPNTGSGPERIQTWDLERSTLKGPKPSPPGQRLCYQQFILFKYWWKLLNTKKNNLTFEDQKPQGSSGSTSNYWMWSCNNYTIYNKILNKIIKNYELDKLKTKEPISIKIKSQNANLWSFQTKDPHKH